MRKSVLAGRSACHQRQVAGSCADLSHYLSGQRRLEEVIVWHADTGAFYDICRAVSAEPDRDFASRKNTFRSFSISERSTFNYIIIDCAPIGAAIDAAVVAKYCDGAIIVIGQGMASARMIQSVKKQLEASGVRILGAVLDKVNNKKSSHVSGYYGNYYGSYYGQVGQSMKSIGCRVRKIKYAAAMLASQRFYASWKALYQGACAQCHGCLQCAAGT